MRISINTEQKTIQVESNADLGKLFDNLEKLLPENHPMGSWKTYKLITDSTVVYWSNPITYIPSTPWYGAPYYITCTTSDTMLDCNDSTTVTTASTPATYNVEIN